MAVSEDYLAFVNDQLTEVEGYYHKKMFGGVGYFVDDYMFGAIMDNVFRLKADEETAPRYAAHDCGPHEIKSRNMTMPYYEVPQHVLEDRSALNDWVNEAIEVAKRTKKKKKK